MGVGRREGSLKGSLRQIEGGRSRRRLQPWGRAGQGSHGGKVTRNPLASSADLGGRAPAAWCACALRAGSRGGVALRSCRVLEPGAPSCKCRRSQIISGPLSQVFANWLVSCCKGNTFASPSTLSPSLEPAGSSVQASSAPQHRFHHPALMSELPSTLSHFQSLPHQALTRTP